MKVHGTLDMAESFSSEMNVVTRGNELRSGPEAGAERVVAEFEIRHRQYLDASGKLVADPPAFARDRDTMVSLYRAMTLSRIFDAKAIALQRTGQLGTYPSSAGQEAACIGYASAMTDTDVMMTTYREQPAQIWRGVTLTELLQFWGGDEAGSNFSGPREDFPVAVLIASHATHAVGVATAFQIRKEPRVAVCALGDGATSKGDFYESVNVAGVWRLPVVFMVINNYWAISMPREKQTAAQTLAQKAIAGGIPGIQVDGNDIIAVREVMNEAMERARSGGGPTVVEALTYRMGDHTTADDASRYRREELVSAAWKLDPVARARSYLVAQQWWTKEDEEQLIAQCRAQVDAAVTEYLKLPPPSPTSMFDNLFEKLPHSLEWQRKKYEGSR
jgi:2-oxoisovalerate dehydrogenase E1 component alpha subunit